MPKTSKRLTISIVIPVYNEAVGLAACLDSIAGQTVRPDEVIVVDNGSSDGSAAIAGRYDFVTVVHEPVRGMMQARNRGFDTAKSDIIGRIDGDIMLADDWVERVVRCFAAHDIGGLTGPLESDLLRSERSRRATLWSRVYLAASSSIFRVQIMMGGNMAISRRAWRKIRRRACMDSQLVHEDQDLSVLLATAGYRVMYESEAIAALPEGTFGYHDWARLSEYIVRGFRTRQYHQDAGNLRRVGKRRLAAWKCAVVVAAIVLPAAFFIVTSLLLDSARRLSLELASIE